jgi:hypothetical protein
MMLTVGVCRIGGGDQIYNDGIRVTGPLAPWSNIHNPKKRKDHPFPESLRLDCDDYYLKNYIRWYVTPGPPRKRPLALTVCAGTRPSRSQASTARFPS